MDKSNRFWIELERGTPEEMKERAKKLSIILKALGCPYREPVFYAERTGRYCFTVDLGGCYTEAVDNGFWFNLDYYSKHNEPKPNPLDTDENIGSVEFY